MASVPALPADELTVAYQAADEWEGRTPVCWAAVETADGCVSFMLDIEGTWASAQWRIVSTEPDPCMGS